MPIPISLLVVSAILSPSGDHDEKCGTPGPTPLWEVSSIASVTIAVAVGIRPVQGTLDDRIGNDQERRKHQAATVGRPDREGVVELVAKQRTAGDSRKTGAVRVDRVH